MSASKKEIRFAATCQVTDRVFSEVIRDLLIIPSLSTLHKDDGGAEVGAEEGVLLDHKVGSDVGDGLGDLSVHVLLDHDVLVLADAGLHALELVEHTYMTSTKG